jgi:hypothetical protein
MSGREYIRPIWVVKLITSLLTNQLEYVVVMHLKASAFFIPIDINQGAIIC